MISQASSNMWSELPFDLLDNILEQFDERNQAGRVPLANCSLVCKAWLPLCRSRLFRSLYFRPFSFPQNREFFKSPLTSFVRKITLTSTFYQSQSEGVENMIANLVVFRNLRCLRINRLNCVSVQDNTISLMASSLTSLKRLEISDVVFRTVSQLRHLISSVSTLQELSLYPYTTPQVESASSASGTQSDAPPVTIHVLEFSGRASGSFTWIYTQWRPHFHDLDLQLGFVSSSNLQHIGELLRFVGTELHQLQIGFLNGVSLSHIRTNLQLCFNPNIRVFSLHIRMNNFSLDASMKMLSLMPASLEILNVTLAYLIVKEQLDRIDWPSLDNIVMLLQPRIIQFYLPGRVHWNASTFNSIFREKLPKFAESGLLTVDYPSSGRNHAEGYAITYYAKVHHLPGWLSGGFAIKLYDPSAQNRQGLFGVRKYGNCCGVFAAQQHLPLIQVVN
ncbi:hypothetical protein BD779DRAFT_1506435 [Infundibulicybe gibba]|nr:hypothetical protein BD779DRAFT_1506435 [Infundibulicybe gibba]